MSLDFKWKKPKYELSLKDAFALRVSVCTVLNKVIRSNSILKDMSGYTVIIDAEYKQDKKSSISLDVLPDDFKRPFQIEIPGWALRYGAY